MVAVLGDSSVGKTCLVERFVSGRFFPRQAPTIGLNVQLCRVPLDPLSKPTDPRWSP